MDDPTQRNIFHQIHPLESSSHQRYFLFVSFGVPRQISPVLPFCLVLYYYSLRCLDHESERRVETGIDTCVNPSPAPTPPPLYKEMRLQSDISCLLTLTSQILLIFKFPKEVLISTSNIPFVRSIITLKG